MFCPNCGTFNSLDKLNCIKCQQALPRLEPATSATLPATPGSPNLATESWPNPNAATESESKGGAPARPNYYPGIPGSQYSYNAGPRSNGGEYVVGGGPSAAAYAPHPYATPFNPPYTSYNYGTAPARAGQQFAGFWVRLGAWLIDSIIVNIILGLVIVIPQIIYWVGFVSRFGDQFARNCSESRYASYSSSQQCNDTFNSVFLTNHELGNFLVVTIVSCVLALILVLAYQVGLTAGGGTLGKRVFGLRVVKEDGSRPGFGRALLRMTVGYWLSSLLFYLGFIWVAFDERKQGWHDKIAGTYVIKV